MPEKVVPPIVKNAWDVVVHNPQPKFNKNLGKLASGFKDLYGGIITGTFKTGIRYLDKDGIRYLEQNPEKLSEWGKKAKKGHKIAWAIHLATNTWLARYEDGTVTELPGIRSLGEKL